MGEVTQDVTIEMLEKLADGNYKRKNLKAANVKMADNTTVEEKVMSHLTDEANPHGTTKAQIGLGNVDNVKQMPMSGGTFTGVAVAQTNTSYTTRQLRNVIMSTADPSGGSNGDIWIKYK